MSDLSDTWFDDLPRDRCIAEVSMWSADLARLGEQTESVSNHADMLHIDVADGVFAPAFLFFPDLVTAMRKRAARPIHVHLMVAADILLSQVEQFIEAGADLVSVHAETDNAAEALALIAARGAVPGVVLRLETPVEAARPLMADARMLTLLGTAIGVKGQGLSSEAPGRLRAARRMLRELPGPRRILAADGAIRDTTVPKLLEAGAETVVMGSLYFSETDPASRMTWLSQLRMA